MIYVLDTHALVWHLEANPRLSPRASEILNAPQSLLVVPSIVLAEIWHLYQRKRIRTSPEEVRHRVLQATNCSVYPLDEAVLELLPTGLEIHDAIIVATTRLFRDVLQRATSLITCDEAITRSGSIEVLW